jgi:hypothetical protein
MTAAGTAPRRIAVACALAFALPAWCDAGAGAPYDPGCLETVAGEVTRVERLPQAGGGRGMHLVLRTDAGDRVSVALGPLWVADRYGIHVGDRIEVMGWPVVRGKSALVAAELKSGDRTIRLRDREGVPLWRRRTSR